MINVLIAHRTMIQMTNNAVSYIMLKQVKINNLRICCSLFVWRCNGAI